MKQKWMVRHLVFAFLGLGLTAPGGAQEQALAPVDEGSLIKEDFLLTPEEVRSPDSVSERGALRTGSPSTTKPAVLPPGVLEKSYEGSANVGSPQLARRKIIDEATFKVSEQVIQAILGEARYKKNKTVIVDKIFRQSGRYIPVIKAGELVSTPEGQKLVVNLQINTKILESLLQAQGLLYDNESAPMLISFVTIDDQVRGASYRWWQPSPNQTLLPLAEHLESQLQKTLFNLGFFAQRPEASEMSLMVPSAFQQESLTPEQVQVLCNRWGIPLGMVGNIVLRNESNGGVVFDLRVSVVQVSTGRVLAQLYRQNKLAKRVTLDTLNPRKDLGFMNQAFRDLGLQMQEAWQRGALSSTIARLEIQGGLPLNKYDLLKEALKNANRSIRQVRERLITGKSVLFEIEVNGSVGDLAGSLTQITAGDRNYRFKGLSGENTLVLVPMR